MSALGPGTERIAQLQRLLRDGRPEIVQEALEELGQMGDAFGFALAAPLMLNPEARVREAALRVVLRLDREQALRLLRSQLALPDEEQRGGALHCVSLLAAAEADPLLAEAFESESLQRHLEQMAGLLARSGSPVAVDALAWAAHEEVDPSKRLLARMALGEIAERQPLSEATLEEARRRYGSARRTTSGQRLSAVRPAPAAPPPVRRGWSLETLGLALLLPALAVLWQRGSSERGPAGAGADTAVAAAAARPPVYKRVRGRVEHVAASGRELRLATPEGALPVRFAVPLIAGLRQGMLVEAEGQERKLESIAFLEADGLRVLALEGK